MAKKEKKKKVGRPRKRSRGLPKSSYQWKKLYERYQANYDKLEKRLKKEGVDMETGKLERLRDFKLTFASMRQTLLEKNQRPSYERVVDQLVNRAGYRVSRTSALSRKRYLDEEMDTYEAVTGDTFEHVSVKDIMLGKVDFTKAQWDRIKELYHTSKDEFTEAGIKDASRKAKDMISSEIFGSA